MKNITHPKHSLRVIAFTFAFIMAGASAAQADMGYVIYKKKQEMFSDTVYYIEQIQSVSNLDTKLTYVITTINGFKITNIYTKPDVAAAENAALKKGASINIESCGIPTFPKDSIKEYIDYRTCNAGVKTPTVNTEDLLQNEVEKINIQVSKIYPTKNYAH